MIATTIGLVLVGSLVGSFMGAMIWFIQQAIKEKKKDRHEPKR